MTKLVSMNGRTQRGTITRKRKLPRLVREAIADGRHRLALRTQGEIQSGVMQVQTFEGHWTVRRFHPEDVAAMFEPPEPNGRIEQIDHYVTTPRYRNVTRMNQNAEALAAEERRARVRRDTEARDAMRAVQFDDE